MAVLTDFSIEGYSSLTENPIWLWKVDPVDGESLTSWIARLSAKMQISMPRLLGSLNLSASEIKADLDVNPPVQLIKGLAFKTGECEGKILGMTLSRLLPRLLRDQDIALVNHAELNRQCHPWIIPNGLFQDRRPTGKKGRTPYCPSCLVDGDIPFTPLVHRLSTIVICPKHKAPLRENCPHCGEYSYTSALSICTELSKSGFPFCWKCSYGPRVGAFAEKPSSIDCISWNEPESLPSMLAFHQQTLTALSCGLVDLPQIGQISSVRFFQGLRIAVPIFVCLINRGVDPRTKDSLRWPPSQSNIFPKGSKRDFDGLPIKTRLKIISYVAWLIEHPIDHWKKLYPVYFISPQLPLHWTHPWEAIDESGVEILEEFKTPKDMISRSAGSRDEFRTFFSMCEQIGLNRKEIAKVLGGVDERTVMRWSRRTPYWVRNEDLQRMMNLVHVWSYVRNRPLDINTARAWIRSPIQNPVFLRRTPLELLFDTEDPKEFEIMESFFGQW
jgi:hypothetical protein